MIPLLSLIPIVSAIMCVKVGTQTLSHLLIFLTSAVEFVCWILVIPKIPEQSLAMVMLAFLLIRIIISIVAYETYYRKLIDKRKQAKLLGDNEKES